MRAAVLETFEHDLVVRDLPVPEPGAGELLVRVRAAGVCGTDLKIIRGAIAGLELPLVPGHEVAGELVDGGHGFEAGQRVAVHPLASCHACEPCRRGNVELCPNAVRMGFERDGGLAEYVTVKPENVIPVDDRVSFTQAAVSMDAVLVPWRALRHRANVQPGDTVVIVGAGGIGLHGVLVAVAAGCRVAVVDPAASHRQLALDLGAELAVDPSDDATDALIAWSGGGADVAFEVSGVPSAFTLGTTVLRPGGLIVAAGYRPGAEYAIDSMRLALSQIRIEGNRGGKIEHAHEALAAVARGEFAPLIDRTGTLAEVNDLLGALAGGEVLGRVVVEL